ncbi:MAG: type II secretion system F family protein [Anaerolineae bacterium]|nr:MAG: type II secretion system F family protein [Anaerolineae bacterium]
MLTWIILGVIILGLAIALIVVGGRFSQEEEQDPLQARLAEFAQSGEVATLEEIELSQPLRDRIIIPLLRRIGEFSTRFTPQRLIQETEHKLEMAGNPLRIDAATFLASRFVLAGAFGGFLFLIFTISPAKWPFSRLVLVVGIFSLLGFLYPQMWLQSKINRRQKDIRKAMPDALDLLTICVEAGLGFDAAMSKVVEKWDTELSMAFARVIREIQLGKTRREALRDMADRIGIPELSSFVAAIIQSEQLGVSLAKVLRIQADQMRIRRRQHAEEEAHKAPVKMILPMALLIFPSILIILLTPAMLRLVWTLAPLFGG